MGRTARSRRPPLTRERKNQHLPPSRAGRVTFSRTLTRWSTAGRAGRQGFGGLAFPADGGTDGLGRSFSVDSSGQGRSPHHPAEKTPLRAAQRVGVFAVDRENGGFGPIRPDPVRKGRAPCRRGSRDAFACSV